MRQRCRAHTPDMQLDEELTAERAECAESAAERKGFGLDEPVVRQAMRCRLWRHRRDSVNSAVSAVECIF